MWAEPTSRDGKSNTGGRASQQEGKFTVRADSVFWHEIVMLREKLKGGRRLNDLEQKVEYDTEGPE